MCFSTRTAFTAVAVVVGSLLISAHFDAQDPRASMDSTSPQASFATEGDEPQSPSPADLMSAMQGKVYVDKGTYDKASTSSSHSEKEERQKEAAWHTVSSLPTTLRQIHHFTQAGTTKSTCSIAIVILAVLIFCTCAGFSQLPGFGDACKEPVGVVPVLGQREMMLEHNKWPPPGPPLAAPGAAPGPFLRSAVLSPFASALMPTPMMTSDQTEHAMETEPMQKEPAAQAVPTPPPLCPTLVMPVCEARFGVPMYELAQLSVEGELNIVGLSGNPLLRAVVRKIGNARTLEISMPEQNSAPRATISPSTMELAGHGQQGSRALEIRGMRGSFYGLLEMRNSGACFVIKDGQTVLTIDGDAESLQLSIKSSVGLQLASVRCSAEPFGGVDHVEIRVEPGVDTVLVLAVVLAVLLLSPYLPPSDQ